MLIGQREQIPDIDERFRFEFLPGTKNWRFYDLTHMHRYALSDASIGGIVARQNSEDKVRNVLDFCDYWNEQPIDLEEDERLLWFVYSASEVLRASDGQQLILPNGDARRDLEPHSCRVMLEWATDLDLCPSKAEFFFDARLLKDFQVMSFEPPGKALDQRAERVQVLQKYFTLEPLMAQFQVVGWTNFAGLRIPQAWSLNMFFNGQQVKWFFAEVDSIAHWTRAALPPMKAGTLVDDKRFHEYRGSWGRLNWLAYPLTSDISELPPVNDPRLVALVEKQAAPWAYQQSPNLRKPRILFTFSIIVLLFTPVVALILAKMGRGVGSSEQRGRTAPQASESIKTTKTPKGVSP